MEDYSKLSDQELMARYQKSQLTSQTPSQGQFQQPQVPVRKVIGDFMTRLGGGTPATNDNDLTKLYQQEMIKKQFEDDSYVVSYDANGQPVFNKAPGQIKNAPFYSTQQGGQYYGEKTRQAGAQADQAGAETDLMNQVLPAVQDAMAGNKGQLPPGASISAGPVTFQPNPRLTDTEQAAVAGSQAMEPVIERILQNVRGGIYGSGNDVERTARQGIVDSGNALLSSQDTKLQAFQSDINNLKRLIPFTDGGKQLTPFEAKRVFALLNTTGKNDPQIANDIQAAVSIVMAKGGLAIGGRNAAMGGDQQIPNQPTQLTPEQQTKRQRISQKYGV